MALVWHRTDDLNVARIGHGGCGTQKAALLVAGMQNGPTYLASSEEFDGVWTLSSDITQARAKGWMVGTQGAGLWFGGTNGSAQTTTDEYDGSAWSAGGGLATGRFDTTGAGTQAAGLAVGGWAGGSYYSSSEEYDGASWSSGGSLSSGYAQMGGAGTQSDAIAFGGGTTATPGVATHEYDGAAWSSGGDLNTARETLAGCGASSSALSIGGYTTSAPSSVVEEYNGSSWSAATSLSTQRYFSAAAGSATAAMVFGGYISGTQSVVCEEYDDGTLYVDPYGVSQTDAGGLGVWVESESFTLELGDYVFVVFAGDAAPDLAAIHYSNHTQAALLNEQVAATNSGNVVVSIRGVRWSSGTATNMHAGAYADCNAYAIACYRVRGLTASALDRTASATGSGNAPSSGATATLSQADEVAIGAIGMEEQTDEEGTQTEGDGYVDGHYLIEGSTSGGAKGITIMAVAEIVSATTALSVAQTATGSNDWAAAVATFKKTIIPPAPLRALMGVGK